VLDDASVTQTLPDGLRVIATVAHTQSGRWRGRPRCPCNLGMASTSARACCESLRLAPVSWMARGTPRPSQTRWRLLPSLARSVGFGPVCSPQKLPGPSCRLQLPGTKQSVRSVPASLAKRSVSVARCPPVANHATAASRSCPNHTRFLAPAFPREFRYARRTESQLDRRGLVSGACLPWVHAMWAAAAVESDSTKHQEAKGCS
jgi:hypothetical protein